MQSKKIAQYCKTVQHCTDRLLDWSAVHYNRLALDQVTSMHCWWSWRQCLFSVFLPTFCGILYSVALEPPWQTRAVTRVSAPPPPLLLYHCTQLLLHWCYIVYHCTQLQCTGPLSTARSSKASYWSILPQQSDVYSWSHRSPHTNALSWCWWWCWCWWWWWW